METTAVYKGLMDRQRIRILNLLEEGPLCVCHLMEILEADQVKVSKQLRYMKELGLLEGERQAQWMVYRLTGPEKGLLVRNLEYLRESGDGDLPLRSDLRKRAMICRRLDREEGPCPDLDGACCAG